MPVKKENEGGGKIGPAAESRNQTFQALRVTVSRKVNSSRSEQI
jgi:hypothetical protein